jgi:hypothetical protein
MFTHLPKTAIVVSLLLSLVVVATACSTQGPATGAGHATLVDVGEPGLGPDDGYIKSKALSPFADDVPAIANLDPDLRQALQDAATAAMGDGVDFVVTSGWRSAYYQQSLFDDAVRNYGSAEVAAEFVLSPEKSRHVFGQAVDIGFTDANSWLSQHGADYGLCQIYANEMWHFELATERGGQCPEQLTDASAG